MLGNGELHAALTIKAAKFSASAEEKIAAAGGKAVAVAQVGDGRAGRVAQEPWARGRCGAAAGSAAGLR